VLQPDEDKVKDIYMTRGCEILDYRHFFKFNSKVHISVSAVNCNKVKRIFIYLEMDEKQTQNEHIRTACASIF